MFQKYVNNMGKFYIFVNFKVILLLMRADETRNSLNDCFRIVLTRVLKIYDLIYVIPVTAINPPLKINGTE